MSVFPSSLALQVINSDLNLDLYSLNKLVKSIPMHPITKAALERISVKTKTYVDCGSGSISVTPMRLVDGLVYPTAKKIEIKRVAKDKEGNETRIPAADIAKELRKAFATDLHKNNDKEITGSEWLRSLEAGSKQDHELKDEIETIEKEEIEKGNKVTVKVLSQNDETANSHRSFLHLLRFMDKTNKYLKNVTPENSGTGEVGNSSGQGSIMPTQKVATAGKNVSQLLAKKMDSNEIVKQISETFFGDMIDVKIENLFVQGLLAVTLEKTEVMTGLGIAADADAWKTCQISRPVVDIIKVLKEQKPHETFTTTLAFLEAVLKKHGKIEIFCAKEPMPLYDENGKQMTFVDEKGKVQPLTAKINSAHGDAVGDYTELYKTIYKANETYKRCAICGQ